MIAADRAFWIVLQLERAEFHVQRAIGDQPADRGAANAEDQLYRFGCLERSDGAADDAQDAALGTARDRAWIRGLGIHAAITRPLLAGVGVLQMRREDRHHSLEAEDGAVHV